ncbi:MAG: tRNA lysidine(34) synthetase TilS [Candidatus Eisenbacteria sp.]|nr:tRNA lysidine(34) synthetase TilS [Candidatus Eisenbacteria bacterium]
MDPFDTDPRLHRFFSRWERALHEVLPAQGWQVLAAVSGGADSVLLAYLLRTSAQRDAGRLVLGHIHHGLRAEADQDAAFVRQLAADWDLPLEEYPVPAAARADEEGWSLEQAARVVRLQALVRLGRAAGCRSIVLGHHLDDQAETVLMRILRGTGPRGLGGMEPRRKWAGRAGADRATDAPGDGEVGAADDGAPIEVLRPLLGFRRAELRAIAGQLGLRWVEDRSNEDPRFLRNRVRHELLPHLAGYNPRIVETLAQLAQWQRLEDRVVTASAGELRKAVLLQGPAGNSEDDCLVLDARGLAGKPPALVSRVLWLSYQDLAGPEAVLSGRQMSRLLELLQRVPDGPPGEVHLPGAIRARYRRGRIVLEFHQPRPGIPNRRQSPRPLREGDQESA